MVCSNRLIILTELMKCQVFDIPSSGKLPFEKRLEALKTLFPDAPTFHIGEKIDAKGRDNVTLVDRAHIIWPLYNTKAQSPVSLLEVKCISEDQLMALLGKVQNVGGEG